MQTPETALKLLLEHAFPSERTQTCSLPDALGRVLAEDVVSPMSVPPFDRSPLDGYALKSADIEGATQEKPACLRVIGEADAGCTVHFTVASGEALRIMTGAPVPESCDCVIRQEDTDEGMDFCVCPLRHEYRARRRGCPERRPDPEGRDPSEQRSAGCAGQPWMHRGEGVRCSARSSGVHRR